MTYNVFRYITILSLLIVFTTFIYDYTLPSEYYDCLRILVTTVSVYSCYRTVQLKEKESWIWTFGVIALLFNPILKVHLQTIIWKSIDLITAIIYIISIKYFKNKVL
jgi:hypothetical protein